MPTEMCDDDYKLTPSGPLGSRIAIGNGKFIAERATMEEALEFVKSHMGRSQYFPNIWWVSDHGNAWLIDLEGNEIHETEEAEGVEETEETEETEEASDCERWG